MEVVLPGEFAGGHPRDPRSSGVLNFARKAGGGLSIGFMTLVGCLRPCCSR